MMVLLAMAILMVGSTCEGEYKIIGLATHASLILIMKNFAFIADISRQDLCKIGKIISILILVVIVIHIFYFSAGRIVQFHRLRMLGRQF